MTKEWPDEPITVTDSDMDEFVKKYDTAVIDCWAEWCQPCKMMEPILEEVAEEMKGDVAFGKLNVDSNRAKSAEYGISSIPTLLIFKNGGLKDQFIGVLPKDALKEELKKHI
ncbi:MAG: thioredoxin [Thermoplasmata archaeon]